MIGKGKKLGDLLIESGYISQVQLGEILNLQKATGMKFGEVCIKEGFITEREIIEVLELQLGIPFVNLKKYDMDIDVPKLINENLARKHMLIPLKIEGNRLTVAMADPLNIFAREDVQIATNCEVYPVIASAADIMSAIDQFYGKQRAEKAAEEFKKNYEDDHKLEIDITEAGLNEINSAPIVKLINTIVSQAVKMKASDIHIEPYEDIIRVRFRVDGELQEIMTPSKAAHSAIVTRVKIMGKMNIAEKRIPQDGRVETSMDGKEIDMRISTLPTVFGEKVVIRILDRSGFLASKDELGLSPGNMAMFEKIIKNPNGIIIVTGPTGSGKSTTLYSVLGELNKPNTNIITVEDPVEYRMKGINQVQVNGKAGLTFVSGLRSILRQDPDIIMIGEIRDSETGQIAVRAAITGHLVLSTMHTNDAPSAVSRLIDMDVEPYLVSSALVGVISQRLVRKICTECSESYAPSDREKAILSLPEDAVLYKGRGCKICGGSGYKGRTAIHEVMPVSRELRTLIGSGGSIDELRDAARRGGTTTLYENCKLLVINGDTTLEEMIRITYSND